MWDKGQSQMWGIIDYIVLKCHSYFLVSQPSSGQGESEEEKDVTKTKLGKNLYTGVYMWKMRTHGSSAL